MRPIRSRAPPRKRTWIFGKIRKFESESHPWRRCRKWELHHFEPTLVSRMSAGSAPSPRLIWKYPTAATLPTSVRSSKAFFATEISCCAHSVTQFTLCPLIALQQRIYTRSMTRSAMPLMRSSESEHLGPRAPSSPKSLLTICACQIVSAAGPLFAPAPVARARLWGGSKLAWRA